MSEQHYCDIIRDETNRALWEVRNVIECIPDSLWNQPYCEMPLWKHVYHMLHSLDQWYMNPRVYKQPCFHTEGLNDLDSESAAPLSWKATEDYFETVKKKITEYDDSLTDELLLETPERCEWSRFELILAQHRHLHSHMGIIMGFLIAGTGRWPKVLGLEHPIPENEFGLFY